jgi:metal-responsive CopG/Arc/MetJ family transcriptional regulator
MAMDEIISCRVPYHLFVSLEEYSKKVKIYRATIIRDAVAAYLAQAGREQN